MVSKAGKYNVKAISTMLEIQPGTLRAWERRYQIIEPIRNPAGHRLYSDEHVAILRWLLDKVDNGFTIGQAVDLFNQGNVLFDPEKHDDYSGQIVEGLMASLLSFKESEAEQILSEAFSLFSIEKVTIDLIGTLVLTVKRMRVNKEISVSQEQFVLSFMRMKIGTIFQGLKVNGSLPKVIAACGPNETNELGLLIYSLFLRRQGFEVIYLGTGIPFQDLELIIKEYDVKMFFTSCIMKDNLDDTVKAVGQLGDMFPNLIIGAGGYVLDDLLEGRSSAFKEHLVGKTKRDWEVWLKKRLVF